MQHQTAVQIHLYLDFKRAWESVMWFNAELGQLSACLVAMIGATLQNYRHIIGISHMTP